MAEGKGRGAAAVVPPSRAYAEGVAAGRWRQDPAQAPVLRELDRIHAELSPPRSVLARLRAWLRPPAAVRGLYLWGGVGRGKTFLVDLLYEHVPIAERRRIHFHRFMGEVHAALRQLERQPDPLSEVARILSQRCRLLVLDEFFVADIGDAMILGRLLERLIAHRLTLVATSNSAPSALYHDGLQRARFLPAIALLERHCAVVHLGGGIDYRLRQLSSGAVYHRPLDAAAEAALADCFARLARDCPREDGPLRINGRPLAVKALAEGIVWFEFDVLCRGPRAVADYIELARDFHTLLVSGVPVLAEGEDDPTRRLVHLVDELYDRNVNLIVSAAAAPEALYRGGRLAHEFARTASRLTEMQSKHYLARPHRP